MKRNHLMIHVNAEHLDFIMIAESWLNTRDGHQIAEAALNGCNAFPNPVCIAMESVEVYANNRIKNVDSYDSLYVDVMENDNKYILKLKVKLK